MLAVDLDTLNIHIVVGTVGSREHCDSALIFPLHMQNIIVAGVSHGVSRSAYLSNAFTSFKACGIPVRFNLMVPPR